MLKKGIIIHPDELDDIWAEQVTENRLDVLGLHPVGGEKAHETLEDAISRHRQLPDAQRLFQKLEKQGVQIEYEAHALRWLLPGDMFASHPDFFRMDEEGHRTPHLNLCPSNKEALDFVSNRAETLARLLPASSGRYFFWLDDARGGKCHCEKCRHLSASDQQMLVVNAMLKGVKRFQSDAKMSYLAYADAMEAPEKVQPDKDVFLEYAPFYRDAHRPLFDKDCEKNVQEVRSLQKLLDLFGKKDAQVLEYWMDNSLYSNWTKPPKAFTLDTTVMAQDVPAYRQLGFEAITSFGCYLGADYRALHGYVPIREYADILHR